ncbi:MAG TPA: PA14 domain-containing protein [Chloroflexia bacterium]|nr:PA14 domain-containing protein [Chloroflexia bacterium]
MSEKVTILDSEGNPAGRAIVTLDNSQQVITDDQGVAAFSDVMLHDHWLNITYRGNHYRQPLHAHTANTTVALGMSDEDRRLGATLFAIALCLWVGIMLGVSVAGQRRKMGKTHSLTSQPLLRQLLNRKQALPVGTLLMAFGASALLLGPLDNKTGSASAAPATLATLPIPAQLAAEEDDNNAILTWNGGPIRPDRSEPAGVGGYRVSWGVAGQPLSNVQYTQYRILQIQPLTNGVQYQAQVQSVDMTGNLSAPSATISFTGNPARVNALRARMTGFFDDFNRPAGAMDELKWNQAYSRCNSESYNSSFINTQFHAHNMISDLRCDRGQVVNRPRATFDFTGRTGTIAFDVDGAHRRDSWYLDLAPQLTDITANIADDENAGVPSHMLRIKQSGDVIELFWLQPGSAPVRLAVTDNTTFSSLEWIGLNTISNVRRHWEVKVSQSQIQIFINGKLVLASGLSLPFSKATVQWTQFSYNTPKANEPYSLLHWDNFGFDGPAPTVETHNYRTDGYGGKDFVIASNFAPVTKQINIPDSLAGATAQRLMFTLQQTDYSDYIWSPNDRVIINGKSFAIPKPVKVDGSAALIDYIRPYSEIVSLTPGTFITGINQVQFVTQDSHILNIHAEIDFPKGQAPAYTQPDKIYPTSTMPPMPEVGMGATLENFGNTSIDFQGKVDEPTAQQVFALNGVVPITFKVQGEVSMIAMGKNPGAAKVQVRLNKFVLFEQDLNGAPFSELTYNFDTTKYRNGQYQLDVVAYTASGTPSIPDYYMGVTKNGDYYPARININNAVSGTLTPGAPPDTTVAATTAPVTTTNAPATTAPATTVAATTAPATTVPTTGTPAPPVLPSGSTNGLNAEYFNNMTLSGVPVLKRVDSTVNFDWDLGSPDPKLPTNGFSARWTGQVKAASNEMYTFCTQSDDGVRLWVNNVQLINNWTNHGQTEDCGQIALKQGQLYNLKLEYYENVGDAVISLWWRTPTISKQVIPAAQLFTGSIAAAPRPTVVPASTTPAVATTVAATTPPASNTGAATTVAATQKWQMKATVSGTPAAGSKLTINTSYTAPVNVNGQFLMDVELYDLTSGKKVAQWNSLQSFTSGQTRTFAPTWTALAGNYQVRLGIFDPNWQFIDWLQNGPTIQSK